MTPLAAELLRIGTAPREHQVIPSFLRKFAKGSVHFFDMSAAYEHIVHFTEQFPEDGDWPISRALLHLLQKKPGSNLHCRIRDPSMVIVMRSGSCCRLRMSSMTRSM
jgi:hypothetical protein